ncbi:hypothetical protein [Corynebacterium pseudotuberculosis]|uniref:hypothetical protein n=1 Tax=Corynebacterium pseudotuberculosis TaxID=1719 RepID=UPI0001DD849E|nr:hypothetical protein [Corynebacterium pseudotuberculosis]AEX39942.1 Hypothetical protein Cp3995_1485 [Corynebacterium pseudotuberculosis 3/99-5]ALU19869.1 hypothetical protein AK970_06945 [Corynebacterium pseudotuberculosis]ANK56813.1 Hypothetical protein CpPA02_1403 [Corynebacterium pseudotuberculosis]AZN20037.1 hypothetical protein CpCap1W_1220 [Corynebacterium pseudotuberculosis]AZN22144.1 Hypothetical protein CpOviAF1_1225 [Corynebacterium pseudotuberculosis]
MRSDLGLHGRVSSGIHVKIGDQQNNAHYSNQHDVATAADLEAVARLDRGEIAQEHFETALEQRYQSHSVKEHKVAT